MTKLPGTNFWIFLSISLLALLFTHPVFAIEGSHASKPMGKFMGGKPSESPEWFKESFLEFEEDIREAADNNKRLMLFIHQEGCPYCARLVNENFKQDNIAKLVKQNFDGVSINLWGDREIVAVGGKNYTEKSFAEALKVQYTPTLFFFNEKGKVALRINGYYPPEKFRLALDYVIAHKESELSFNEYVASKSANPGKGALNKEPFFSSPPYELARNTKPASRPLAVFFEQPDCDSCDVLHNKILKDPPTRDLIKKLESVQLNMWSDTPVVTPSGEKTTAREWAKKLNISYVPSVVFFDENGKEVERISAFLKTFHVQSIIDYVLTKGYIKQPSFQRYISARAEHFREQGLDVDIWSYKSLHAK